VTLTVGGQEVRCLEGESLAAGLMAAGILQLRASPRARTPRGAFCFMGVCQECLVRVDGTWRQACLVTVADGMVIEHGVPA
jgi:D-hydroxyproline dehydrogenase subunit gamma